MGSKCDCKYYLVGLTVKNPYEDSLDWLNSTDDVATFKKTFSQDIASSLTTTLKYPIHPNRVISSIVTPQPSNRIQVIFLLTEECVDTYRLEKAVHLMEYMPSFENPESLVSLSGLQGYMLMEATAPATNLSNSTIPTLDDLYNTLKSMHADTDTTLYLGIISNHIDPTYPVFAFNPNQQPQPSSSQKWITKYYWVIIIIGVVFLFAVLGIAYWKCPRQRKVRYSLENAEINEMNTASAEPTAPAGKEIFQESLQLQTPERADDLRNSPTRSDFQTNTSFA